MLEQAKNTLTSASSEEELFTEKLKSFMGTLGESEQEELLFWAYQRFWKYKDVMDHYMG